MFVGLISDTHGVFSDEFKDFFEPVDVIWHAGDFGGGIEFADSIAGFKPLVGVYGNCDGQDIRRAYPSFQEMQEQGLNILMTHIGGSPGHYDLRAQDRTPDTAPSTWSFHCRTKCSTADRIVSSGYFCVRTLTHTQGDERQEI